MRNNRLNSSLLVPLALVGIAHGQLDASAVPISQWTTLTTTVEAYTVTVAATTATMSAQVIEQDGALGNPYLDYPGVGYVTIGDTTVTSPATTVTRQATTETYAAHTQTRLLMPEELNDELLPAMAYDLFDVAPTITSVSDSTASKLNIEYEDFYVSYVSAHPTPAAINVINEDLDVLYNSGPAGESLADALINRLYVATGAAESASLTSALGSLLSPHPSLSADVAAYLSAIKTWGLPEYNAEISLLTKALSITSIPTSEAALLSIYSTIAAAAASGGSGTENDASRSSQGDAAPTQSAMAFFSAGLAAAGVAVVAML